MKNLIYQLFGEHYFLWKWVGYHGLKLSDMVKKIIGAFVAVIPLLIHAQVNISVQLPPAGLIQKNQLWNLVLINNDNQSLDVNILMNLQDASTGQTVLSGTSNTFILPK